MSEPKTGPRIAVVGTRGIPDVQGGVERHCEELYPRLVERGCRVHVYGRKGYCETGLYRGVEVRALPAPGGKGVEALLHTALAILAAASHGCDVLHVHSVGPGVLVPFARRVGHRRIVFTEHAPDYEQSKWGRGARMLLKAGERSAVRRSDAVICVAGWLARRLADEYGVSATVIPNGPAGVVQGPGDVEIPRHLRALGLAGHRYVAFVGRLIPDKRVEDLLAAAERLRGQGFPDVRVAVVGGSADAPDYERRLKESAGNHVVFTGSLHGAALRAVYEGASAFVLPSAVEGLPVALMEAMSAGLPVVTSAVEGNLEVLGTPPAGLVFDVGDVPALAEALAAVLGDQDVAASLGQRAKERVLRDFSWDAIAAATLDVYRRVADGVAWPPVDEPLETRRPA